MPPSKKPTGVHIAGRIDPRTLASVLSHFKRSGLHSVSKSEMLQLMFKQFVSEVVDQNKLFIRLADAIDYLELHGIKAGATKSNMDYMAYERMQYETSLASLPPPKSMECPTERLAGEKQALDELAAEIERLKGG